MTYFSIPANMLHSTNSPLISILSHLSESPHILPSKIHFLYTTRQSTPDIHSTLKSTLFLDRLTSIARQHPSQIQLDIFITPPGPDLTPDGAPGSGSDHIADASQTTTQPFNLHQRRITREDLISALGPVERRKDAVAYVCGPPAMTDEFVAVLRGAEGVVGERVLCEKWW